MVGCHERVIFVNAAPHSASSVPTLTFNLEDEGHGSFQSSAEVITQVGHVTLKTLKNVNDNRSFMMDEGLAKRSLFCNNTEFSGHVNMGLWFTILFLLPGPVPERV